MLCVRRLQLCQTGRQGQVLATQQVQCREPKIGQQKVQLFKKTINFAHLLGILFIYVAC